MNILILGAGHIGSALAKSLSVSIHNITVIDLDKKKLNTLLDKLDIGTVQGSASVPSILEKANIEEVDMLIAVTDSDETNMVACQISYTLYSIPIKIARIKNNSILKIKDKLFKPFQDDEIIGGFFIDYIISPENMITNKICDLIDYPGVIQFCPFPNDIVMVSVIAYYGGALVGSSIEQLYKHLAYITLGVVILYRNNIAIKPLPSTVIEAGDEVFFTTHKEHIHLVQKELQPVDKKYKNILIVGGGEIGYRLGMALEKEYQVKLIESDEKRALFLANALQDTLIFQGNIVSNETLEACNMSKIDLFIATTKDDKTNMIACMLAKNYGVEHTMSVLYTMEYHNKMFNDCIDIVLKPDEITVLSVLAKIRQCDISCIYFLHNKSSEVMVVAPHGDHNKSLVIGKPIAEIKLPQGVSIHAIIRESHFMLSTKDIIIESGDYVILVILNNKYLQDIEKLFKTEMTFI